MDHPPNKRKCVDASVSKDPPIVFHDITLFCHIPKTLQIDPEPKKYTERLSDSLLKYFSFLYLRQHSKPGKAHIQVHLQSVVQNLDLQVESKRLGMTEGERHYSHFQYCIPVNERVSFQWYEFVLTVLLSSSDKHQPQSSITSSLEASIEKVSDGDSVQSGVLSDLIGKPASTLQIQFMTATGQGTTQTDFELLCHEATEYAFSLTANSVLHTKIYTNSDEFGAWEFLTSRKKRPWDSVALPESIKEDFLKDITTFLKNKEFYERNGLRYKRVYALIGPAGCGKSSLIEALAGILNMSLCYLNVGPQMDNGRLCRLIAEMKKDSIAVIEDIDSMGLAQEQKDVNNPSHVTYSCVLNILDGAFHQEGLVTILTANSLNGFGEAFKRFGRIDRTYTFSNIQELEMKLLYHRILHPVMHDQWPAFYKRIESKSNLSAGLLSEFFASLALEYKDTPFNIVKMIPKLNQIIKSIEKSKSEEEKMMYGEI